jgi:hypothetical protein
LRLPFSPLFRIDGGAQSTTEFRLITPKPLLESPQLAYLSSAGLVSLSYGDYPSSTSPNFFDLHSSLLPLLSFINQPPLFLVLFVLFFAVCGVFCILNLLAQQLTLTTGLFGHLLILSILVLVQLRPVVALSCLRDTALPFQTPTINLDLSLYPLPINYLRDFINYQLYTHFSNWC